MQLALWGARSGTTRFRIPPCLTVRVKRCLEEGRTTLGKRRLLEIKFLIQKVIFILAWWLLWLSSQNQKKWSTVVKEEVLGFVTLIGKHLNCFSLSERSYSKFRGSWSNWIWSPCRGHQTFTTSNGSLAQRYKKQGYGFELKGSLMLRKELVEITETFQAVIAKTLLFSLATVSARGVEAWNSSGPYRETYVQTESKAIETSLH